MKRSTPMDTRDKLDAVFNVISSMIDAVKANPDGLPSGHLYAVVMGHMSLEQYYKIEEIMIASGRVKKQGDLLTAV